MYFFHERLVHYAIAHFQQMQFATPEEGDACWGLFAPGNTQPFSDRPFERFSDYEEMLLRLRDADQVKFERMHKGTAFYLMSWLALDLRNYEKGLFYIDSAISEDVRKTQGTADPHAKLRNTTGHNLVWDDVFADARIYADLSHQVMNAIFFVISTKGR